MGYKETAKAIRDLKIQGAHSIALAGVKSLLSCKNDKEVREAVKLLHAARPTEPGLRNAIKFAPNKETDPKFAEKLSEARIRGIKIFPVQISFDGKIIYYNGKIPLSEF